MILIIDNYDSFTYNLNDYFQQLNQATQVSLHDKISISEISRINPQAIVISPGPCGPKESKISKDVVDYCLTSNTPLLGVCLGMQTIAYQTGANIVRLDPPVHGKISEVTNNGRNLFLGLPENISVTRYHSLIIDKKTLSNDFEVDAYLKGNKQVIMAISHKTKPIYGVQYHPESICSEHGLEQLNNFLKIAGIK